MAGDDPNNRDAADDDAVVTSNPLAGDLDDWDKMFDDLHESGPGGVGLPTEPETLAPADDGEQGISPTQNVLPELDEEEDDFALGPAGGEPMMMQRPATADIELGAAGQSDTPALSPPTSPEADGPMSHHQAAARGKRRSGVPVMIGDSDADHTRPVDMGASVEQERAVAGEHAPLTDPGDELLSPPTRTLAHVIRRPPDQAKGKGGAKDSIFDEDTRVAKVSQDQVDRLRLGLPAKDSADTSIPSLLGPADSTSITIPPGAPLAISDIIPESDDELADAFAEALVGAPGPDDVVLLTDKKATVPTDASEPHGPLPAAMPSLDPIATLDAGDSPPPAIDFGPGEGKPALQPAPALAEDDAITIDVDAYDEAEGAVTGDQSSSPSAEPPPAVAERYVLPGLDIDSVRFAETAAVRVDVDDEDRAALEFLSAEVEAQEGGDAESELRLLAGRLCFVVGELTQADEHFRAAALLDSSSLPALRGLRRVAEEMGDWAEVADLFRQQAEESTAVERTALQQCRLDTVVASGEFSLIDDLENDALLADCDPLRSHRIEMEIAAYRGDGTRLRGAVASYLGALDSDLLDEVKDVAAGESGATSSTTLRTALHYEQDENWSAAAAAYDELADASADAVFAAALFRRAALCHRRREDKDAELTTVAKAASRAPMDLVTHLYLADCTAAGGDWARAAIGYQHAAGLATTDPDRWIALRSAARSWLGLAAIDRERSDAARAAATGCYREVADLGFDDTVSLQRAIDATSDPAERCLLLEALLGSLPESPLRPHLLARLAESRIECRQYEAAAADLRAANPEHTPVLLYLLERSLAFAQRFEERAELLARVATVSDRWCSPLVSLVRAARAAEDAANHRILQAERADENDRRDARTAAILESIENACTRWRGIVKQWPEEPEARHALLSLSQRLAYRTGDPQPLVDALEVAQSNAPIVAAQVQLALRRAGLYLGIGDAESIGRAVACLDECNAAAPGDPRIGLARMLMSIASNAWVETAEILIEIAEAMGATVAADSMRFRAAGIYADELGDLAKAGAIASEIASRHPGFEPARELMMRSPSTDESATEGLPESPAFTAIVRAAEAIERRGDEPQRAMELYERATEFRPGDPIARMGLVRTGRAANHQARLVNFALAELRATDADDEQARARAYEYVAVAGGDLRGERDSSVVSLQSAVELEPSNLFVLRALEVCYGIREKWSELRGIYHMLADALGDAVEAAPLAYEASRTARKMGDESKSLVDARRARELDRRLLEPLFDVDCDAQRSLANLSLAEIEAEVADYFEADGRSRATFLTAAGETLLMAKAPMAALEHFRGALEAEPTSVAAMRGMLASAIAGEQWADAMLAAVTEANAVDRPTERARLRHLAGVIAMDRLLDNELALEHLALSLEEDAERDDTFARMRLVYDEDGRYNDLIELIEARVAIDSDESRRMELHGAAANLYRTFFDDRDGARRHYHSILEIDPGHRGAITSLADIAFEVGDWAQAADALRRLCEIETDEGTLRNVYHRLASIYIDHLGDPGEAVLMLEQVIALDPGDHDSHQRIATLLREAGQIDAAVEKIESLLAAEKQPAQKAVTLLLLAEIHRVDRGDEEAATDAEEKAFAADPANPTAVAAVLRAARTRSDVSSFRDRVDRMAATLRQRVHKQAFHGGAYASLSEVFAFRHELGVSGADAASLCAAELGQLLGADASSAEERLAASENSRPSCAKLASHDIDSMLIPRALLLPLRTILARVSPLMIGAPYPREFSAQSVTAIPSVDAVAAEILEVAESMGCGNVNVAALTLAPAIGAFQRNPSPTVIIGPTVQTRADITQIRFIAGRWLKLSSLGLAIAAQMTREQFMSFVTELLRLAGQDAPFDIAAVTNVGETYPEIARLMSSELADAAGQLARQQPADLQRAWSSLAEIGNRAGLLACGSIAAAVGVMMTHGGYSDIRSAVRDVGLLHLIRFAVSEEHIALRATLDR